MLDDNNISFKGFKLESVRSNTINNTIITTYGCICTVIDYKIVFFFFLQNYA